MRYLISALAVFLLPISSIGQKLNKYIERSLYTHINILASDSLEGRRAGTIGEHHASEYISKYFKTIGLAPLKDIDAFTIPFDISEGEKLDSNSYIKLNNNNLELNQIIFLPFTVRKFSIKGTTFANLKEKGGFWMVDIKDNFKNLHPHSDIISELSKFTQYAVSNGCQTIMFYNAPEFILPGIINQPFTHDFGIPALYLPQLHNGLITFENPLQFEFSYSFSKSIRKSNNVVGYLDNRRDTTIIVGAHYDHLGYGEDGNSMLRNGAPQIHNGADDNASGTTALLEIAKHIVNNRKKYARYNFIFAAFSGEELGLLGSKQIAEILVKTPHHIKFMLNLDMVGRLNPVSKAITIGGYGTSPSWSSIFGMLSSRDLTIKFDSTGSGPSDHTSFYRKNIPVLFYFTGLHQDYHKPTDDIEKININGITLVIKNVLDVVRL
ncbi:MAG: M28 family peptidase, partial [Chitinophagaceae bacterium]